MARAMFTKLLYGMVITTCDRHGFDSRHLHSYPEALTSGFILFPEETRQV